MSSGNGQKFFLVASFVVVSVAAYVFCRTVSAKPSVRVWGFAATGATKPSVAELVTVKPHKASKVISVYRTFYCASGAGCTEPICGGNKKTAWGRDASKGDGCAVDKRRIPFGSKVTIGGVTYISDDTFGRAQRARDWERGIVHVDIRVAGKSHREVARMGAGLVTAIVEER